MFKIINAQGRELGKTERPYYIKAAANGSLAPCEERDAQGVTLDGAAYALFGVAGLPDNLERVVVVEVDGGHELDASNATASVLFVTLAESGQLDPVTATEHAGEFAEWAYPVAYREGMIRRDPEDGALYRVNVGQSHTSQQGWNPSRTLNLWTKIGDPGEEWPAWAQPIGAQDAYKKASKTTHKGQRWTSALDNNVWEPGVYGWTAAPEEAAQSDEEPAADGPATVEAVNLDTMTVAQLKAYAAEHEIDLTGKTLKADILAAIKAAETPGEVIA